MAKFKQLFSGGLKYKAEPEYMVSQYELNRLRSQPFENLVEIENCKNGELCFKVPGGKLCPKSWLAALMPSCWQKYDDAGQR